MAIKGIHPFGSVAGICVLVTATGTVALALAGPAAAKPFVQDSYIEVPQCQPATSQLCPQIPTASIGAVMSPSVTFTANSNHCSDIIAHVFIDGEEFGSDLLEPGETTPQFPLEDLKPHTVGIQAEGIPGGCNRGWVDAWGGTLHFTGTLPLS
ncbi:MAG TPA: hypothetical protein PKI77_16980 [Mycobacterium sp.]|nr:hypothetical protein [Mycobacterium sp.]